jgi:hypothetical protein
LTAGGTRMTTIQRLKVVSYIHLQTTSTFGLRLLAMVHQSNEESPDICRWVDSGRSVEITFNHDGFKPLLLRYFQRKCAHQKEKHKFVTDNRIPTIHSFFDFLSLLFRSRFQLLILKATAQQLRFPNERSPEQRRK